MAPKAAGGMASWTRQITSLCVNLTPLDGRENGRSR